MNVSVCFSRPSREYVSQLWLRRSDQVGLRCRVLQCARHLHSHCKEARWHVLLPSSRHWLLTGHYVVVKTCHKGQCYHKNCRQKVSTCVFLKHLKTFNYFEWVCAYMLTFSSYCRILTWILKRWTERLQRRRGSTSCPAACRSTVSTPDSAHCRNSG